MAHLQVYFRDSLKEEVELKSDVTTIGRSIDNDIMIDNAGVSSHHAKIVKEGNVFVIEDVASRNGIFVNGKRISRQPVNYGDDIEISKHTLKLTAIGRLATLPDSASHDTHQIVQGATVEVDVSNLGELMKQRQAKNDAYLLLTGVVRRRSKFPLVKLNLTIGKAKNSDVYTPGWFAPGVAARVVRKSDGFYIAPEKRGKVRVNGMSVSTPRKLEDGDGLEVRGLTFKFYIQHPE